MVRGNEYITMHTVCNFVSGSGCDGIFTPLRKLEVLSDA